MGGWVHKVMENRFPGLKKNVIIHTHKIDKKERREGALLAIQWAGFDSLSAEGLAPP